MLTFFFTHIKLWIVLIIVVFFLLSGSVVLEAWLDFKKTPKVPMFWCDKHGFFEMKHCLPLFPELGGTPQNSYICPTCYREAVFTNPNRKK